MSRAKKGYVSSLQGLVRLALVTAGLSREEELALARRAVKGDREAQNKLIQAVAVLAENYGHQQAQAYKVNADELIAEGLVGIGMALNKFKPEKKVRFATYAIWWVRVYVDRYIREFSDTWESTDGTKKIRFISTSAAVHPGGEDDLTLEDQLESSDEGAEVRYQAVQYRAAIQAIVDGAGLTAIEKSIVKNRFMEENLTLEELGARHGVSRERIRQIEISLRPKLRAIFEGEGMS